jgi:hypothetical protein
MNTLTALPEELLDDIYNKLHVLDRFRFNHALGKKHHIHHTTMTDKHKDRKLAMASIMFKNKMVDIKKLPVRLLDFLSENRDDPTVRTILKENNLVIEEAEPDTDGYIQALVEKMNAKKVSIEDFLAIPDESLNNDSIYNGCADVFECVAQNNSISLFELVMSEPRLYDKINTTNRPAERFIFSLINYRSIKLLKFVLEHDYPFVNIGFKYVKSPVIAKILGNTPEKVDMILKYVGLDQEAKLAIYKQAIDKFNIDMILKMKSIIRES